MRFADKLSRLRPMGAPANRGKDGAPWSEAGSREGERMPSAELDQLDARAERIERLRGLIGEVARRDRRRQRHPLAEPAPLTIGQLVDNGHGPMYLLERHLEPDHCHGRAPVRSALQVPSELVSALALDMAFVGLDLSRMLILDTETTGLAGGAGTVPFLIGMAYFDDGVLKVEQLFLRNLGGEAPLLRHLAERIAGASCVVSYNGKSFDWPLLRSRYILNRVAAPALPPHLDLLHCARRVYKGRLEAVKLTTVEREILGFYRDGDVPGAEIPGLYMSYLRGGDARGVLPILEHNELDVIALASLLGELGRQFTEVQRAGDPRDHLAYARVAVRAGDTERGLTFAEAAAAGAGDAGLRCEALELAATIVLRRGDLQGALQRLQAALRSAPRTSESSLHLSLAKIYEHRVGDLAQAYLHARHTGPAEEPTCQGRRLGRLHRRLLRGGEVLAATGPGTISAPR